MKLNTMLYVSAATTLFACGTKNNAVDAVKAENPYQTVEEANMNTSVSPKEDFFEFSNGTWCKENPVPNSESRWGSFNELDMANKAKLKAILTNAAKDKGAKGSQNQILGDYYLSFLNFDARNAAGLSGIKTELDLIDGIQSTKDLTSAITKLHTIGVSAGFYFGVGQDMMDVKNNILNVYQGGTGLPNRDYYFAEDKAEILAAYKAHIAKVFEKAGISSADAEVDAQDVIAFETNLAEAMMTPSEQRIPENTYNLLTPEEVYNMFGAFDFSTYLQARGINTANSIVVGQPEFVRQFAKTINKTPITEWKTYLKWKVLDTYAGHLTEDFAKLNFDFYGKTLSGKKEMKPLNEQVIEEMTGASFSELLGKAFVEENFSESAQVRVNEMVDNLLEVFGERINNLTWMSTDTKKEALNKLNSIGRKLGFPEEWQDFTSLDFKADDYIGNIKKSSQFAINRNIKKYGVPVNKKEWGMPAHMVNAYYHPLLNEIAFPAGIMQPPFFSDKYEDAVNYGRIGMVIGHEFTHGFDDMGSKFAADGTFKNWWTEEDKKSFEEKTLVFGETYGSFCPIDGHCVNPELTMGENIADLGGLTLAYYAYAKTPEFKSGIKRKGYTPAQRFFISYAQLWKINYTQEELKNRLANDPHSPGMYRVNGPLMNCPEFFEAFDVKAGDNMRNTEGKVANIW